MKDIEIIEINRDDVDECTDMCIQLRNERYYIGYEKNPLEQNSVLFSDLSWIRKHFGVDRHENSIITHESLNEGRRNSIKTYELCIKANIPMWELDKVNEDGTVKINPNTGEPYKPNKLTRSGKKKFQEDINKGLHVLCKIVDK